MFRQEKNQTDETSSDKTHYWHDALKNLSRLHLLGHSQDKASLAGERVVFTLDLGLVEKIEKIATANQCKPKHFFLSALYTVLLQYNQEPDITLGTTYDIQHNANDADMLPLRITDAKNDSFLELMRRYCTVELNSLENKLPIDTIFGSLDLQKRSIFKNAKPFQILLDTNKLKNQQQQDATPCPFEYFGVNISQEKCLIEFNAQLFNDAFINRFFKHFENVLSQAIEKPDEPISSFQRILPDENKQIMAYNHTETNNSSALTLQEHSQQIAATDPKRKFVCFYDNSLKQHTFTYQEVNDAANQLAHYLQQSLLLTQESYIGIALDRSPRLVRTFLAALKAGIPIVPLDINRPGDLEQKLRDKKLTCILTDNHNLSYVNNTTARVINLDDAQIKFNINTYPTVDLKTTYDDTTTPVYKIYTSGSTGTPKGIVIPRSGLNNLHLALMQQDFPFNSQVISTASFCFDAWYFDLILAIAKNGALHLTPEAFRQDSAFLNRIIKTNNINVGVFVPDLFEKLNNKLPLTHVILMGAPPTKEVMNAWLFARSGRKILNGYGPTENSIATSLGNYRKGQDASCIGRGLSNIQLYCVDPDTHQILPPDVEGEIWIAGPGLAIKYDGLPELTETRFVNYYLNEKTSTFEITSTNTAAHPIRLYKTGDYGRFCVNSNKIDISFTRRKDRQIKLEGARIELDGVQQLIKTHAYIKDTYVMLDNNKQKLIAFVILQDDMKQKNLSEKALRHAIIKHLIRTPLPLVAYPKKLIALTEMPLNANGKVDEAQLKKLEIDNTQIAIQPSQTMHYTPFAQQLLPIWRNTLGLTQSEFQQTDEDDWFIELGGTSNMLLKLKNAIVMNRNELLLDPSLLNSQIEDLIKFEVSLSMLAQSLEIYRVKTIPHEATEPNAINLPKQFSMFSNGAETTNHDKTQTNNTLSLPTHQL